MGKGRTEFLEGGCVSRSRTDWVLLNCIAFLCSPQGILFLATVGVAIMTSGILICIKSNGLRMRILMDSPYNFQSLTQFMFQAKTRDSKTNILYIHIQEMMRCSLTIILLSTKRKHLDINNVINLGVTLGQRHNSNFICYISWKALLLVKNF